MFNILLTYDFYLIKIQSPNDTTCHVSSQIIILSTVFSWHRTRLKRSCGSWSLYDYVLTVDKPFLTFRGCPYMYMTRMYNQTLLFFLLFICIYTCIYMVIRSHVYMTMFALLNKITLPTKDNYCSIMKRNVHVSVLVTCGQLYPNIIYDPYTLNLLYVIGASRNSLIT